MLSKAVFDVLMTFNAKQPLKKSLQPLQCLQLIKIVASGSGPSSIVISSENRSCLLRNVTTILIFAFTHYNQLRTELLFDLKLS